ncbi:MULTISPECIES: acyl-CoA thioesterase domain-containing protein [unclassified Gordonia (in: high G+C Gram-positive bacteria)]|uniref:acyl-CoA thioesterase n=1 Tax=unclassified Gordonia (in: high G+C Gram-positive bacteria) TaxID=2657482 RepID=UPI0009ADD8B8|nr:MULTISPECIES: acyl-CoA thioesterase domain-containing protein [unclassified Gordonia (in: high G+C Gram-positive bacteria)]MDF3280769.1 thioesterase family protein [Gordonia sp. N1V]OPX11877.1 hypothetical protein B1964_22000 [Gordonia sp. i37]
MSTPTQTETPGTETFSLLDAFDLTPQTDPTAADAPDTFTARHQVIPSGRAYGGEVVAQAVTAVSKTVGDEKSIHSFHGYFLRPGDVHEPTSWTVDRTRDGRGFSARAVTGVQKGKEIFTGLASFHTGAGSPAHQEPAPELPDPQSLPTSAELLVGSTVRDARYWSYQRHFDIRHDPGAIYTSITGPRVHRQTVMLKAFHALPDDPAVHRQALAYLCDYTLLEPALRYHGYAWADEGVVTASLDHAMWWHNDGRADEWIALVQDVPISGNGRALARGQIYDSAGVLLASVVQEGMLALPSES